MRNHDYIVEMQPLEAGSYLITAAVQNGENTDFACMATEVSQMFIFTSINHVSIFDKLSGKPIENVRINGLTNTYYTDKNGEFNSVDSIKGRKDLKATKNNDSISFSYSLYYAIGHPRETEIFTDKPLYKKGDTIRYYAIKTEANNTYQRKTSNHSPLTILLKNYQTAKIIAKTDTLTNSFGSVSGEFKIPDDYSGEIEIACESNSKIIKVEDYKAPQIEIIMNDEFRIINFDSILISGKVVSLNNYPASYSIIDYKLNQKQESTKIIADQNGHFNIIIKNHEQDSYVTTYLELTATTPSGHTATCNKRYNAFLDTPSLRIKGADYLLTKEKYPTITLRDYNNKPVSEQIEVIITRQVMNDDFYYYCSTNPEILFDTTHFNQRFSTKLLHDQTGNPILLKHLFDNESSANDSIAKLNLQEGCYQLKCRMIKDTTQSVTDYFSILSPDSKNASYTPSTLYIHAEKTNYEIGDTIKAVIGCCNNGDFYHVSKRFNTIRNENQLKIKIETFRNKIEPKKQESWKIKVTDSHGKPVKAELLGYMYNSALRHLSNPYDLADFNRFSPAKTIFSRLTSIHETRSEIFYHYNKSNYFYDQISLPHVFIPDYYFNPEADEDLKVYVGLPTGIPNDGEPIDEKKAPTISEVIEPVTVNKPDNIRKDLNDSGVFSAHAVTDDKGYATIGFTAPDLITRWDAAILAYTKDMTTGVHAFSLVTEKELMVSINKPRFMREGDKIVLSARVDNLTGKAITCHTTISIKENNALISEKPNRKVKINAGESQTISWTITPTEGAETISPLITASTSKHQDAEMIKIPVLSNKTLITETTSMIIDAGNKKEINIPITPQQEYHRVKIEVKQVKLGDRLKVRMVITAKQGMEYVHLGSSFHVV